MQYDMEFFGTNIIVLFTVGVLVFSVEEKDDHMGKNTKGAMCEVVS